MARQKWSLQSYMFSLHDKFAEVNKKMGYSREDLVLRRQEQGTGQQSNTCEI